MTNGLENEISFKSLLRKIFYQDIRETGFTSLTSAKRSWRIEVLAVQRNGPFLDPFVEGHNLRTFHILTHKRIAEYILHGFL